MLQNKTVDKEKEITDMADNINSIEKKSMAFANILMGNATDEDKAVIEAQRKSNRELRDKAKNWIASQN